jgi:hypothetical protein
MLQTADKLGNEGTTTFPVSPGPQSGPPRRSCEFISPEGAMFLQCRGMRGTGEQTLSVHVFDPIKKVVKLDRAIPVVRERGVVQLTTGPTGLPAWFAKCDGIADGTSACLRTKEGPYREVDLRRALIATGIVDPNQAAKYSYYHVYGTPLLPNEAGSAAAVLGIKNEEGILALSDGRSRTFDLKRFPRRFRAAFRGDEATSYYLGDKVSGIIGPRGGYRRIPRRQMGGRKVKPPGSQAVVYSIPVQGEVSATLFDGYLGRAGSRVLRIAQDGSGVEESSDLGQSFKPVSAPPGLSIDPKTYEWDQEDFCGEMACRMGPWVRIGWGK